MPRFKIDIIQRGNFTRSQTVEVEAADELDAETKLEDIPLAIDGPPGMYLEYDETEIKYTQLD